MFPLERSKNSDNAINGNRAEDRLCEQENVKCAIETHLGIKIVTRTRIKTGKKSDIIVSCDDGQTISIQNKNGKGNGRGHSFDRRSICKYNEIDMLCGKLVSNVCLTHDIERPIIPNSVSKQIIALGMLGENADEHPNYFIKSVYNDVTKEIIGMRICETNKLMEFLYSEMYPEMVPKRTCVHISPSIYLQRKGGEKTDTRPNDIQMKFKTTPAIEDLFTQLCL